MTHLNRATCATAILIAGMSGAAAFGQAPPNAPALTSEQEPAAIRGVSSNPHPATPVAGENSFTESQAMSRLQADGITHISGLKQDGQSIWRGTGTKDGRQVAVAIDYQGNIFTQ